MSTQITTTVDGQQKTLTIQELANGYAAGAKMTQATQRAADLERQVTELGQYKDFWDNIQAKPGEYIPLLAEKFGVAAGPAASGDNLEDDPLSTEVSQLKRQLAAQAQAQKTLESQLLHQAQTRQMDNTVQELSQTYGDNFKVDEVQAYATQHSISDLRVAYHALQGEKVAQGSPPPSIGQTAQMLGSVAPGTPVQVTPPAEGLPPAKTLAEAMQRSYEQLGQEVRLEDIVPTS